MRKSAIILGLALCFILQSLIPVGHGAAELTWIVTTRTKPWQRRNPIASATTKGEKTTITIDPKRVYQEIDGFGGCFNEKGWAALSLLTPAKRDEVLKALFDPKQGAGFNICRVPIGANDYAVSRYTLNEVKDDYQMKHFSIKRDKGCLIPYIKAAMKFRPDLRIWGSVWTPPTWMKTNGQFDGGSMKDDPKVYDAYALYLARFLESYQGEGINAFAVAVQNEPDTARNYPTCLWTEDQFLTFIRDHLGPLFKKRGVNGEIWLGTLSDGDYNKYPRKALSDPVANNYITTVGYQWGGLYSVASTRKHHPDKRIMQTETDCGNWYWKGGYNPDKPQNDWNYAVYTWNKVKDYFEQGVNSYMLWNMVLDEEGKSIDSISPWPQNAAVVIDSKTKSVIYTPMYYAFKHFSHFVKPGAHLIRVKTSGPLKDVLAFKNPDGKVVLVMENTRAKRMILKIKISKRNYDLSLPAQSWSTLIIP